MIAPRFSFAFTLAALGVLIWSSGGTSRMDGLELAYVGPGAGFAFLGSFLTLLAGFAMTVGAMLLWPFRMAWRLLRRRQGFAKAKVKRVIFLGLDGLDPRLTERFMSEGKLPNLARLREEGSYRRLRTTFPSLSPVAWSTFATGVNPARHNIFDFLNRSLRTYVPELSSARVHEPRRKMKIGGFRLPLGRPYVEMRRKSKPFWSILGEQNIGSTIIRVPITFPPDKFNGRLLSAMSTPDLRGTQGSFSLFSSRLDSATYESGSRYPLKRVGDVLEGFLEGPADVLHDGGSTLQIPFEIRRNGSSSQLRIDGQSFTLTPGEYTPWVRLRFRAGLGATVSGIARFLPITTEPDFTMYATPVQIDPEKPALPISHPPYYAAYLAKILGSYSTLGMAEDTWALNEGVIDEQAFLEQSWLLMAEREAMFRNALDKTPRGVVACVFDTSDRIQHMFYRYLDSGRANAEEQQRFGGTIEDLYTRMDKLAGLAASHVDESTVLFVLSDHGFCSFRRGVNLNTWLMQNGYLRLKQGETASARYFENVDWSGTRAYALGLGGMYLNIKGRESAGIVDPAEAGALAEELARKLTALRDEALGMASVRSVYQTSNLYKGPYLVQAPDLIVGFNDGYRISWDAAVGTIGPDVFEDNKKAWSGDHAVDPHLVPGVLFCNRDIAVAEPGIEDLAPTALDLFGVPVPAWMEGRPLISHGA